MSDPKSEPGTSSRPKTSSDGSSPGKNRFYTPTTDEEVEIVRQVGPFSQADQMTVGKAGFWGTYLIEQVDFLRKWGEEKYKTQAKHFRQELSLIHI